ncbi:MAG: hypothetical protein JJE52_03180 [Acidimicrobiia bacterium]|nr:hypothetical protein [Acidimicrobiia bacterium]
MEPTPERFVRLARSSPWRWRTLALIVHDGWTHAPCRARLRRPDGIRIETLDGTLVHAGRQTPNTGVLLYAVDRTSGVAAPSASPSRVVPTWPHEVPPVLDDEGLVITRPSSIEVHYEEPFFQNYRWVAMLDPAELADGTARTDEGETVAGTVVDEVRAVEHRGRAAWEAVVRPTDAYDPRCTCCALMRNAQTDADEGLPDGAETTPGYVYAEAHRMTLDVATGVCVHSEEIGGSQPGSGHEVAIEAVDVEMGDELFTSPRRTRTRPRSSGAPSGWGALSDLDTDEP